MGCFVSQKCSDIVSRKMCFDVTILTFLPATFTSLTKKNDDENVYAECSMFKSTEQFPYAAGPDADHCL